MPIDFNQPKNEKDVELNDEYYESISSLIYPVRGVKVMLDYELAELYGYETKTFNQQVRNNIEKFDETFRFQLTKEEWGEILRSKILTANLEDELIVENTLMSEKSASSLLKQKKSNFDLLSKKSTANSCPNIDDKKILKSKILTSSLDIKNEDEKGIMCKNYTSYLISGNNNLRSKFLTLNLAKRRTLPYAFTEEGIYMLMTVLKGELAIKQSILLIKTFKRMKDFIVSNSNLLTTNEVLDLHTIVRSHDNRISNLESSFNILTNSLNEQKSSNHYLIINGHRVEGDIAYQDIYGKAKHSVFIIDDYIDIKTLQLLKCCKSNVEITIFTDNKAQNNLNKEFIDDFVKDTHLKISIKTNGRIFHDRYIVIDYGYKAEELFHSGPSSKDVGNGVGTIVKIADIEAYYGLIDKLVENSKDIFIDNL